MKKSYLLLAALISIIVLSPIGQRPLYAQGWIGTGNTLYSRNSALALTPIFVGIGTNSPSAQFHTTGSVRFAGLTNSNQSRVLVSDANGNLYYRTVSSLGTSGWSLTGNATTASNFIGTTNAQPFIVKTNNTQRIVVNSAGHVGINKVNPLAMLDVKGTVRISGSSPTFGDANGLVIETNADSANQGGYITFINTKTSKSFDIIQGGNCGSVGDNLNIIYYADRNQCNNYKEVMSLQPDNVGIRVESPTANFHVKGTVRLQDLPSGSGTPLVIDANGNVYRSSTGFSMSAAGSKDSLQAKVNQLQDEISTLKLLITQLQAKVDNEYSVNQPKLFQNYPNPYTKQTTIGYFLPEQVKNAKILIFDSQGKEITQATLKDRGRQQLTIQNDLLASGLYFYTLYVNGKNMDTKKMVVAR